MKLLERLRTAHQQLIAKQEDEARERELRQQRWEAQDQDRRLREQIREKEVRQSLIAHLTESGLIDRLLEAKTFLEEQGYSPSLIYYAKDGERPYDRRQFLQNFANVGFDLESVQRVNLELRYVDDNLWRKGFRKWITASIDEHGAICVGHSREIPAERTIETVQNFNRGTKDWMDNPELLDEMLFASVQSPYQESPSTPYTGTLDGR